MDVEYVSILIHIQVLNQIGIECLKDRFDPLDCFLEKIKNSIDENDFQLYNDNRYQ